MRKEGIPMKKILAVPEMMEAVAAKTDPLADKTSNDTDLTLPDAYQNLISGDKSPREEDNDCLQYFSCKRINSQHRRYIHQSNDIDPNACFKLAFFAENKGQNYCHSCNDKIDSAHYQCCII